MLLLMKKNKIVGLIDDFYRFHISLSQYFPPLGMMDIDEWIQKRKININSNILVRMEYYTNNVYKTGKTQKEIAQDVSYTSLKDDYWVWPFANRKNKPKWEDIQMFIKDYKYGVLSSIHFLWTDKTKIIEKYTPDNTTSGWSEKFWTKKDGKHYLCKREINNEHFDCLNKLNRMREKQKLPKVNVLEYKPMDTDGLKVMASECFTSENVSFVELPFLLKSNKKTSIQDVIKQFKNIKGAKEYFEMIVLSAYLTNASLDPYDIGFLVNEKNKIIAPAPIIDTKQGNEFFNIFDNTKEEIEEFIKSIVWFSKTEYDTL